MPCEAEIFSVRATFGPKAHYKAAGGDLYLLDIYNLRGDPATIVK